MEGALRFGGIAKGCMSSLNLGLSRMSASCRLTMEAGHRRTAGTETPKPLVKVIFESVASNNALQAQQWLLTRVIMSSRLKWVAHLDVTFQGSLFTKSCLRSFALETRCVD